jgi:flagellar biosynthesis/type III secretory pathway protein FliH
MPEDTPTLAPPPTPIPTEAPVPETATPPSPEPAAQAEDVEESVEPTVAWADTPDIDGLFEIEEVKTRHTKGIQEAHDQAYSEVQGHMQPAVQANKQTLDQINTATESIRTTLDRAAEDGALDKRAVEDLLRTHRGEFAALNQQYQTIGYWEGVKQYITSLLGDAAPTFLTRLERMQQNVPDPMLASDMQKSLRAQGHKEGHDEGYKKGLKENRDAATEQEKLEARKGKGANLTPGSPAGGRSDNERLLDQDTPLEEIKEIRARQKAAGG